MRLTPLRGGYYGGMKDAEGKYQPSKQEEGDAAAMMSTAQAGMSRNREIAHYGGKSAEYFEGEAKLLEDFLEYWKNLPDGGRLPKFIADKFNTSGREIREEIARLRRDAGWAREDTERAGHAEAEYEKNYKKEEGDKPQGQ